MPAPEVIQITRDLVTTLVPSGTEMNIPVGTEIIITQALGDTYTAIANGQMVRISGKDADALGKELPVVTAIPENMPIEEQVWMQLRTCYDPEIPVNIVDLGLIYGVDVTSTDDGKYTVLIRMTLTAPGCGMGPIIANEAKHKVMSLSNVNDVTMELVFDPPWDRSMISMQAKLELGLL